MITLEKKRELFPYELDQLLEEGKNLDYSEVEELKRKIKYMDEKEIDGLYEELTGKEYRKNWNYNEPNEKDNIRKLSNFSKEEYHFTREEVKEKIRGAWFGRIIGNMLGKPVEGWNRENIIEYLKAANSYPLENYIPELASSNEKFKLSKYIIEKGLRGKIKHALRDDDVDYTVANLELLEDKGFNFSTYDVAEQWINKIPYAMTYTAEREAYRNIIIGLKPPQTAKFWNPFREWIGAQIRADVFGYVLPGKPKKAAELAYRDATLSHTKNGVYGEIFIAATISASFFSENALEAIKIGQSYIPTTSRLYEAIENCLLTWKKESSFEEAYNKLMDKYGKLSPVHTINNEVIVVLSLLYGDLNFSKTIGLAVTAGLDTDCNGATVGSIVGVLVGERNIESKWKEPLNDTVEVGLSGHRDIRISELSERTLNLVES
ncbi:MAG: ADP-ribosylglycohydrolase family protein [Thermoproteota archaeon]|nr:ADP-ribosylglycohydrolase family protein [Candidatus Brockarchaeota archaeon]MBO3802098.1 ADP-ribosylglycohydrolase family protein [Candidatus Brockarchaeota archaeon]